MIESQFEGACVQDGSLGQYREKTLNAISMKFKPGQNDFIAYLNSLHNIGAGGANALAEAQAINPYFGELYVSLPLIDPLVRALTDNTPRVVILSGHAGDGKSTVALDVLKKLRGLDPHAPLPEPLKEREDVLNTHGKITIVKDMSELTASCRQQWLHQAFEEPGSWLIISNTGPLLTSLTQYAKTNNIQEHEIENDILSILDRPLNTTTLDGHRLDRFAKTLLIINLTRWNNLALVGEILARLVNHTGWYACNACDIDYACPLNINRQAIRESGTSAQDRVRWVYHRLAAYEQRLTLRQIVAHLAFALTGGISCDEARQQVTASTAEGIDQGTDSLEKILFSEGFFGYRAGQPWPPAEGLQAVALVRRVAFGTPVAVEYERQLPKDVGFGWASLPESLACLERRWRQRSTAAAGVRWRFAARRMAYLFGRPRSGMEETSHLFLDTFLHSPALRDLDRWQADKRISLSLSERERLLTACLKVLLEIYSGYSAGQFQSQDTLYLTVRRPDRSVVQPTQLVIEELPFRQFDLEFDSVHCLPVLRFNSGQVSMPLSLPLLDYIRRRDSGELGNTLTPIHQARLDWFQAKLLQATSQYRRNSNKINLIRSGISGDVRIYRLFLDPEKSTLEVANG